MVKPVPVITHIKCVPYEDSMLTTETEWLDNTRINDMMACPLMGIISRIKNKTYLQDSRSMPLEFGKTIHEAFAVVRLYQLGFIQGYMQHMHHHGVRLFKDRWETIFASIENTQDHYENMKRIAREAIYTSDFYDDPNDKDRTVNNAVQAIEEYVNKVDFINKEVFVFDKEDPTSMVGIEVSVDMLVTVYYQRYDDDVYVRTFRFKGKIDGVSHHKETGFKIVEENKTTSAMGGCWSDGMMMSQQTTGYILYMATMLAKDKALTVFCQPGLDGTVFEPNHAQVIGLKVPLYKRGLQSSIQDVTIQKLAHHVHDWATTALHVLDLIETYRDNLDQCPRNTASCTRFFRSCQFIPYCDSDPSDRCIEEMEDNKWDPLED